MLPPFVLDDLLHDGPSDPEKRAFANQGFPALQVDLLHLILLVLEEEVLLEQS